MESFCVENVSKMLLKRKCGIYCIRIAEKDYIGSSLDLNSRLREHLLDLEKNRHGNSKLQRAYNVHRNPLFEVVEYCSEDIRVDREQFFYKERGYYNLKDPKECTNFVQAKTVYQYDLDGNFIQTFKSTGEAARILRVSQSAVSKAASAKEYGKYHAGFLWSYKEETNIKRKTKTASPVFMYDLEGNFVKEYYSVEECGNKLIEMLELPKTHLPIAIRQAIDKQKSVKGFQFRSKYFDKIKPYRVSNKLKIYQYDLDWNLIETYEGARECSEIIGSHRSAICRACKQDRAHNGFYFRYKVLDKPGELMGSPEVDNHEPS